MNSNLKKIVMTALFAALSCVATMSIHIPTPGTGGYIHPGDAVVILSGVILGPVYGLLANGWFDWRIFYLCTDYICDQRSGCSCSRTDLPETWTFFQDKIYSRYPWRSCWYCTCCRRLLPLRDFPLRSFRSTCKCSGQHHSGCRRTDHFRNLISGSDRHSGRKTACRGARSFLSDIIIFVQIFAPHKRTSTWNHALILFNYLCMFSF